MCYKFIYICFIVKEMVIICTQIFKVLSIYLYFYQAIHPFIWLLNYQPIVVFLQKV